MVPKMKRPSIRRQPRPCLLVFLFFVAARDEVHRPAEAAFLTSSVRRTPRATRQYFPRMHPLRLPGQPRSQGSRRRVFHAKIETGGLPDRKRIRRATTRVAARIKDTDAELATSSSLGEILLLVFPLLFVYVSNQWSRYSIAYLVDFSSSAQEATATASAFGAMNVDLHFTQSQYGVLASTAFTALFALSSLVAGNLADRYDRKLLTLVRVRVPMLDGGACLS